MSRSSILALGLLLSGCGASPASGVLDDDDLLVDDDDSVTGDDDDDLLVDDDDSVIGDDDDSGPAFDCEALPPGPLALTSLEGLFASEDFAFDGPWLICHQGNALFRQEYPPGASEAFAVTEGGGGGPASLRMLSTGDLVYANVDTSTLYRVTLDGGTTAVYGGLGYAMGIDIHVGGMVFLSDLMGVLWIDPYSGEMDMIIDSGVLNYANGITFSQDYATLYFGTLDGVFAVAVDPDGTPTSEPAVWGQTPGGDGELLGMGVDACGNVYVLHDGDRLLRYPVGGGAAEILAELPAGSWGTNLQWGSGVGGWDDRSIYVTDRGLGVYHELEVGVPSKPY